MTTSKGAGVVIQSLPLLGVTMDDVAYWFSLIMGKRSNKGNTMLETEVGDGKWYKKETNTQGSKRLE